MAEYIRKKPGKEKDRFVFSKLSTAEKIAITLGVLSSRDGAFRVIQRWMIGEEAWNKMNKEEERRLEKRKAFWTTPRKLGASAAAVVAGVSLWQVPAVQGIFISDIVAGVPVQIEDKYMESYGVRGTNRTRTDEAGTYVDYLVKVEQCPGDKGKETPSFDKRVGHTATGCTVDIIKVDEETYSGIKVGQTYTFPGETGERIPKMNV